MEKKPGDLEGLVQTSEKISGREAESSSKPTTEAAKSENAIATEDVPDPDEDDLDDLDGNSSYTLYNHNSNTFSRYA